jgi:hypothetical protein
MYYNLGSSTSMLDSVFSAYVYCYQIQSAEFYGYIVALNVMHAVSVFVLKRF